MYDFYINDELTDKILGFEMSEDLDDVASCFSFSALQDFGLSSNNKLNCIKICEKDAKTPFYVGYITDCEHTTDINIWYYQGFDVGFYLNKNEVIKQFKNANIGDAIKSLCSEYHITLDLKPNFTQKISKIYKDIIFSDVLKDLLQLEKDKGGLKDIYIDCKGGSLQILTYQIEQNLSSLIANNVLIDATKTVNSVSVSHSIQERKNKVIYSDNNEKSTKKYFAQNDDSIATYGLLTSVETVDSKKTNNLQKLANDKLLELNKEKELISLGMLADKRIGKGKVIDINIPEYNLNDTYLITSCRHKIDNQKHEVSVAVEHIVL